MKVECTKNKLKDTISVAERVTGKRLSLPVLAHILLLATEGQIKLRATNLDLGVELSFPAKVTLEGITAVPGDVLSGLLSYLPEEKQIEMELVGQNLTVTSQNQSTIIKCFPYEDFPSIPYITKGNTFTISGKQLISGFKSVLFAVAQTEVKPEFSSVYCYSDSGHLVFVGTDSSRLAEKRIPIKGLDDGISMLIPGKNVHEIIRILELQQGDVEVVTTKSQVAFKGEGVYITSRLIDGNFPDYKQIIPKQFVAEIVVLKDDMSNALKLATVFSGKLQQIKMKVLPEEKLFEIESRNDEVGEHSHQITSTLKGENVELVFNQRFISDVFPYIHQDSISIYAAGAGRPIVLRGVSDQSFTYIVMPLKVVV